MHEIDPQPRADLLRDLQQQIKSEQIARARSMSGAERLAEAFALTDEVFQRMHEGAMQQLGDDDAERGWSEVHARLQRLRRLRDRGRFQQQPAGSE